MEELSFFSDIKENLWFYHLMNTSIAMVFNICAQSEWWLWYKQLSLYINIKGRGKELVYLMHLNYKFLFWIGKIWMWNQAMGHLWYFYKMMLAFNAGIQHLKKLKNFFWLLNQRILLFDVFLPKIQMEQKSSWGLKLEKKTRILWTLHYLHFINSEQLLD